MIKKALVTSLALVTLVAPQIAQAAPTDTPTAKPADEPHLTADRMQGQASFGFGSDGLGIGAGLRVGYTLPTKVHLGAVMRVNRHSKDELSVTLLRPGVEAGYDLAAGPVIIRPYGGAGMTFVSWKLPTIMGDVSGSASALTIWGGAQILVGIPRTAVFVGGDVHALAYVDTLDRATGGSIPIDLGLLVGARF